MRPERASDILLGTTRARAKMHEYAVPERDFNRIPRSPSVLFSLALGMLGDVAANRITGHRPSDRLAETQSHLLFCARFFDSYSESRLEPGLDPYLLLLASTTYYLAELPGSAAVIASRLPTPCPEIQAQGLEELLSWILKANFQQRPALPEETYDVAEDIASLLSTFYSSGEGGEELQRAINALRRIVYDQGTARELLLADLIGAVVSTRRSNSTWTTLPRYSDLPAELWAPILEQETFIHELWPAQKLLGDRGIYRGTSAVVQMPTSAGKTRAIELILRSSMYSDRTSLAVLVAPFRALCQEIRQSLTRAFRGEAINVDELSDVQQADFAISTFLSRQQVLVMTPEKCLYVLRHSPIMAEKLGLLIYDEGHQFDNGRRGVTYELLLTSLKGAISETTQTVLVSAVLNNAQAIADWLLGAGGTVVSGTGLLPTSRAVAFVSWRDRLGRLEFVEPSNPDAGEFFVPRIIEQHTLNRFPRERKDRIFPARQSPDIGLYLALKTAAVGGVAVFVGTKVTASAILRKAVEIYERGFTLPSPASVSNADELGRLVRQNEVNLGEDTASSIAARLGIFAHHGNTPHGIRLAVEHAMKEGLVRVVICTSTLAQGVNLPIRYLIITGAHQGAERIKTRDFHNLLGRAGRSGMYTEGTVIFADPQVYDGRLDRRERWRWPFAKALLDPSKSEECKSALGAVLAPVTSSDQQFSVRLRIRSLVRAHVAGTTGWRKLAQRLATQYDDRGFAETSLLEQLEPKADVLSAIEGFLMAHWSEQPGGGLSSVESLAASTLAFHLATDEERERLVELFDALAENIATQVPESAKRQAFSRSLFGLAENIEIQGWVEDNADTLVARTSTADVLRDVWPLFLRFVRNSMFTRCNPPEPLLGLAERWIDGNPFNHLLEHLTAENCRFGNRHPVMENIVDICEAGFGFDGMLIVGAVAEMLTILRPDQTEAADLLRQLQKQIKYGLSSPLAITIYELGFADRVISQEVATVLGGSSLRWRVIRRLSAKETEVRALLAKYPSYFINVLDNLLSR